MAPFCKSFLFLFYFNFHWQMGSRPKPIWALWTAGQPPTGNNKEKKLLLERQALALLAALFCNCSHRWACQSLLIDFLSVIASTGQNFILVVKTRFERWLKTSEGIKNQGVSVDGEISFNDHVSGVTKVAFFQLRNISTIRGFFSPQSDSEKLRPATHDYILN